MVDKNDFSQFISDSSSKTPKSKVEVTSFCGGRVIETYEAPAGFQFERYLTKLYPNEIIKIECGVLFWKAEVCDECGILEVHKGTYIKEKQEQI